MPFTIQNALQSIRSFLSSKPVTIGTHVVIFNMVALPLVSTILCASRIRGDTVMIVPTIAHVFATSISVACSYALVSVLKYVGANIELLEPFVEMHLQIEMDAVIPGSNIDIDHVIGEAMECPICLEGMDTKIRLNISVNDQDGYVTAYIMLPEKVGRCNTCSNCMHIDCIGRVMVHTFSNGMVYKCPFCRS